MQAALQVLILSDKTKPKRVIYFHRRHGCNEHRIRPPSCCSGRLQTSGLRIPNQTQDPQLFNSQSYFKSLEQNRNRLTHTQSPLQRLQHLSLRSHLRRQVLAPLTLQPHPLFVLFFVSQTVGSCKSEGRGPPQLRIKP